MGVYVYTLRSETKTLGNGHGLVGELVGRAAYSYKQNYSWDGPNSSQKRSIATKHAHAERTSTKLVGKVKHMVYGDKFEVGMDVYHVGDRLPVVFEDVAFPGKVIGKLVKVGRKWCVRTQEEYNALMGIV